MPTVDFTLEDVRTVVTSEMQTALVKERDHTRKLVREELEIQFMSFVENNLTPALDDIDDQFDDIRGRLDRLEVEVKGIRRTVRKHSADIAELQAAKGL